MPAVNALKPDTSISLTQQANLSMSQTQARVVLSLGKTVAGAIIQAIKDWIALKWNEIQSWLLEKLEDVIRELFNI